MDTLTREESEEYGLVLGKAFQVLKRALERQDKYLSTAEIELSYTDPVAAIVKMQHKAMASDALNFADQLLLTEYLGGDISANALGKKPDMNGVRSSFYLGLWAPLPVTAAEAARTLGVSQTAVSKMIKDGRLESIEIGKHTMVVLKD